MNPSNPHITAIIVAAGLSTRMAGIKKEYMVLPGSDSLTVLGSACLAFAASKRINDIIVVIPKGHEETASAALPGKLPVNKNIVFIEGGSCRQASVYNALCWLEKKQPQEKTAAQLMANSDLVLIHDGARPWIKTELIEKIIDAAIFHKAVIPYLAVTDTPKQIDFSGSDKTEHKSIQSPGFITRHLKRSQLGLAQTPQAFMFPDILKAHKLAVENKSRDYTDDAEVWGEFIGKVAVIPGCPDNRKITFAQDLEQ